MSLRGEPSGPELSSSDPTEAPPLVEWTDGALAKAVMLCHVDAYTELRSRHLGSVTAVARRILGNREACDDVVAEVFVGFWLAPEKFDAQRGSVLAYLRMLARGRSIDVVRSDTARQRREMAEGTDDATSPEDDVDAGLIAAEAARALRTALALLPADERTPIELAFYGGLAYGEVARELQLPEGTVKSRIRRGLRRLELSHDLEGQRAERSTPGGHGAETPVRSDAATSVEL